MFYILEFLLRINLLHDQVKYNLVYLRTIHKLYNDQYHKHLTNRFSLLYDKLIDIHLNLDISLELFIHKFYLFHLY